MKSRLLLVTRALIVLTLTITFAAAGSSKAVFTTFSAPNAGTGAGLGTIPVEITTNGTIVGTYIDAKGTFHGFLRSAISNIVSIDAPGAGTASGQGTIVASFLDAGLIIGYL